MNKLGVVALSVLGTVGVAAGAVAILHHAPATKGKLNISYGDTVLLGKPSNNDNLIIPPADNVGDDSLASELESKGYVLVNYIDAEGKDHPVYQKKDTAIDYSIKLNNQYDEMTGEMSVFVGWSEAEDGSKIVTSVTKSTNLYPVFIKNVSGITLKVMGGYSDFTSLSEFNFGMEAGSYYTENGQFTAKLIGISDSQEEVNLVSEIEAGKTYYGVYVLDSIDEMTGDTIAGTEVVTENDVIKMVYGEDALKMVTLQGIGKTVEVKIFNLINGQGDIGQSPFVVYDETAENSQHNFRFAGYSETIDGTETIEPCDMVGGNTYYAVYHSNSGEKTSYSAVKNLCNIEICSSYSAIGYPIDYCTYSALSAGVIISAPIEFNGKSFDICYTLSADSKEVLTDLSAEYLQANNITKVYTAWKEFGGNGILSYNQGIEALKY